MTPPRGIVLLAGSFVIVAALLIVWLNWYWVTEPADSVWHPVQVVLGHMFAIGVGGIGVGLYNLKNSARWTAFVCLALLVIFGVMATVWDLFSQRGVWMALDLALLVLLVMPAVYLLMPRIDEAFVPA